MNKAQAQARYLVHLTAVGHIRPLAHQDVSASNGGLAKAWAEVATFAATQGMVGVYKSVFSKMMKSGVQSKAVQASLEVFSDKPWPTGETLGVKPQAVVDHLAQEAWAELDKASSIEFLSWVVADCVDARPLLNKAQEEALAA